MILGCDIGGFGTKAVALDAGEFRMVVPGSGFLLFPTAVDLADHSVGVDPYLRHRVSPDEANVSKHRLDLLCGSDCGRIGSPLASLVEQILGAAGGSCTGLALTGTSALLALLRAGTIDEICRRHSLPVFLVEPQLAISQVVNQKCRTLVTGSFGYSGIEVSAYDTNEIGARPNYSAAFGDTGESFRDRLSKRLAHQVIEKSGRDPFDLLSTAIQLAAGVDNAIFSLSSTSQSHFAFYVDDSTVEVRRADLRELWLSANDKSLALVEQAREEIRTEQPGPYLHVYWGEGTLCVDPADLSPKGSQSEVQWLPLEALAAGAAAVGEMSKNVSSRPQVIDSDKLLTALDRDVKSSSTLCYQSDKTSLEFKLDTAGGTLGRLPDVRYVVPDTDEFNQVSGRHVTIAVLNGSVAVSDCQSRFGTFVDGQRIEKPVVVPSGGRVRLGPQGPEFRIV